MEGWSRGVLPPLQPGSYLQPRKPTHHLLRALPTFSAMFLLPHLEEVAPLVGKRSCRLDSPKLPTTDAGSTSTVFFSTDECSFPRLISLPESSICFSCGSWRCSSTPSSRILVNMMEMWALTPALSSVLGKVNTTELKAGSSVFPSQEPPTSTNCLMGSGVARALL